MTQGPANVWKPNTVYGVGPAAGKSEPSPFYNHYVVKQQTPKPEAQFPEAVPPWSVHSSAVIHSPLIVGSMTVVHSSFGKVTTENKLKASVSKKKSLLVQWTLVIVNLVSSPILFTNEGCLLFSKNTADCCIFAIQHVVYAIKQSPSFTKNVY